MYMRKRWGNEKRGTWCGKEENTWEKRKMPKIAMKCHGM